MPELETVNPHSTAKIAGHPIHPMIIPFPIAFFVSTFVTDLIFLNTGRFGFATASKWLLAAGIAGALLAAVMGFIDFAGDGKVRSLRQAWLHLGGNLLAVVLEAANLYLRVSSGPGVSIGETILSGVVVALLLFTGWMGWEMVYRHKVGVRD